ncbi:aspartate--ammonia ligase [Belliella sp. DSM 111904]|uniref:Aspartate--ammonia ligase n=1 Tax=Belliella filtrata TaxID=2923435 RepID=A0ABS9V1W8_9BACT|nr:aspartate--ammonia ligase [Belliella filtrata]MCH7410214.1 aspartate--ammonia ligase [Belliella filtrata]
MTSTQTQGYQSILDRRATEAALDYIKTNFPKRLSEKLNLFKVSCPVAIIDGTGINDDLNGIERPVRFPIKNQGDKSAVVVHSLAKWKRWTLSQLNFPKGEGIITDMRALRPDEDYSPIHSLYVDQWDWEKSIDANDRNLNYLKSTVESIYETIKEIEVSLFEQYQGLTPSLPEKIHMMHSEELLRDFPNATPKEREFEAAKKYGAVFLIGIGGKLSNGESHDGRAPDYDDWSSINTDGYVGLNGDILVWNPVLQNSFELSSMGIRVNSESLENQLEIAGASSRKSLLFHKSLLEGKLTESIGGGIGQSRLCMFLLQKTHIGEVQAGIWSEEIITTCKEIGIDLI